jgi:hypothetical protein
MINKETKIPTNCRNNLPAKAINRTMPRATKKAPFVLLSIIIIALFLIIISKKELFANLVI